MSKLALLGGKPVMENPKNGDLFKWPIITNEDEEAILDVVRRNAFSGTDVTLKFQEEFANWLGVKHALAFCNGTMSIAAALFAAGIGHGDEVICPTKTYWATITATLGFGATPVFCNIDHNLSIDPDDIERCIGPKTKALIIVHYFGYPCDMDRIMEIVKKHNLLLIEDVSHAQGGLYKGKKLGTFGHVSAMSLMSMKSFAAGEMGMLVTDDKKMYERALAYAHYERNNATNITECEDLKGGFGIALGGVKGRVNQVSAAMGRVQLKYYDQRTAEIRKAMNYFWDLLDGLPGLHPIRVDESEGTTMGGWYSPHGTYKAEELGGLSVKRFCEAVRAEGVVYCWEGGNNCLHTHKLFNEIDLYHVGKPTRIAFTDRDVRELDKACEASEKIECFEIPWFKHFDKEKIEQYAMCYRKVVENYKDLLEHDNKEKQGGRWFGLSNDEQ